MARYISKLLEDLGSLNSPARPKKQATVQQWRPPEEGWVKINTDAGFSNVACIGRTGVVARDHIGRVVVAAARWFDGVPDALSAEALGAKEGSNLL